MAAVGTDRTGEIYTRWPPEKLARAVRFEADQYEPDALLLIKQELERRGLQPSELDALFESLEAEEAAERRRFSRLGVMLVLLILIVLGNAGWWLRAAWEFAVLEPMPALRPLGALAVFLGLYGLYCAWLLVRGTSTAPAHTLRWIGCHVLLAACLAAVDYARTGQVGEGYVGVVLFALVWVPYLSQSRRVAVRYKSASEQTLTR